MADPVIISYAKGLLDEFPGAPEGIIDVIPVDLVVSSILAVAARGPLAEPDVFHAPPGLVTPSATGSWSSWSAPGSSTTPGRQPGPADHASPSGPSRGGAGCSASCARPPGPSRKAERALQALPLRGRQAELSARLEERCEEMERATSYVELYGAYSETEAIFSVDRLLELFASLPDSDQRGVRASTRR